MSVIQILSIIRNVCRIVKVLLHMRHVLYPMKRKYLIGRKTGYYFGRWYLTFCQNSSWGNVQQICDDLYDPLYEGVLRKQICQWSTSWVTHNIHSHLSVTEKVLHKINICSLHSDGAHIETRTSKSEVHGAIVHNQPLGCQLSFTHLLGELRLPNGQKKVVGSKPAKTEE